MFPATRKRLFVIVANILLTAITSNVFSAKPHAGIVLRYIKELSAIEVALFSESTEFSVFSLTSGSEMLLLTQTMLVVAALTCEASMIGKGNKHLFISTLTCQSVRFA